MRGPRLRDPRTTFLFLGVTMAAIVLVLGSILWFGKLDERTAISGLAMLAFVGLAGAFREAALSWSIRLVKAWRGNPPDEPRTPPPADGGGS